MTKKEELLKKIENILDEILYYEAIVKESGSCLNGNLLIDTFVVEIKRLDKEDLDID